MVDNDGDGSLTQEEFIAALSLPNVQRYLTSLDVRIQERVVGIVFSESWKWSYKKMIRR